jgi:hypothetical protein
MEEEDGIVSNEEIQIIVTTGSVTRRGIPFLQSSLGRLSN